MTIKKRTFDCAASASGTTAGGTVGLGAPFAKILKFEFKGDDTNVDTTCTVLVTDADGRIIYSDSSLDFGADDSTSKQTEQEYSTVGINVYPIAVEAEHINRLGTSDADMGGSYIVAKSPLTFAYSSLGNSDGIRTHVFVEV